MTRVILIILLSLFVFPDAGSQPSFRTYETRSAGISMNLHWMQFVDNHFSPLRYNGPGGSLSIHSARHYGDIRRYLVLGAKADYMWNNLGFNAVYLKPELSGGLALKVNDLSTDISLSYIGGAITATSRLYRFENEDPGHIYWATSYTLDLHYFLDVEIERGKKVLAELNIPLAGAVSRPPEENYSSYQLPGFAEHMRTIHQGTGFATFDRMQAVNLKLLMDIRRTRRNSLSLGYELDFARFSKPEPVIFFSNSLFLRFIIDALVW